LKPDGKLYLSLWQELPTTLGRKVTKELIEAGFHLTRYRNVKDNYRISDPVVMNDYLSKAKWMTRSGNVNTVYYSPRFLIAERNV